MSVAGAGFQRVAVLWPQLLFADAQGLLIEFKGLLRLVAQFVQPRKPMQAVSRFQVLRPSSLESNGERAPEERLRLRIATLLAVEVGQPVEGVGHLGMVLSERLLANAQGTLVERLRLHIAALLAVEGSQV